MTDHKPFKELTDAEKGAFWDTATTAQKLAQIDGGIEVGMNASQIGMNCGLIRHHAGSTIRKFASYHGRNFSHIGRGNTGYIARRENAERAMGLVNPDYAVDARNAGKFKREIAKGNIPEDAHRVFGPTNSNNEFPYELEDLS